MAYTNKNDAAVGADGLPLYGMDKELAEKAAAKFDPVMEAQAREWIEAVVGAPLEGTLQEGLKSGVVLIQLVNTIQPGVSKKASTMSAPFKQMENIGNYLEACDKMGVPKHSTFQTVALYENKDMMQVITNIHALGAVAQKLGYAGPKLGVKLADTNIREFTEEQKKAGRAEQTFLGKGSHGQANAEGMIDHSKNIDKMGHVAGTEGMGINTETGLLGKGSHGHANQSGMVDTSKNIDKMATVQGVDEGMGKNTETGLLGKGSHGQANAEGMIDHSKDIDKMKNVS
jgi:hypothetical protein